MIFSDFLSKYKLIWQIEKFAEPERYCITLMKGTLSVYLMQYGRKILCGADGETCKEAVENLITNIKGQRLRIIGFDSNNEYLDLKIKVPNDLEADWNE